MAAFTFTVGKYESGTAIAMGVAEFSGSIPGMSLNIVEGSQYPLVASGTPSDAGTYTISYTAQRSQEKNTLSRILWVKS